jgi:hypothetical protein
MYQNECPACREDRLHTSDELLDFHNMVRYAPQWRPNDHEEEKPHDDAGV